MSVNSEITSLENYLSLAYSKCEDKGATIPQNKNMANLTACIDSIQGGGTIIPPEAGTLTSLVVGTLPTKTTYTEGDTLDLTGLVVLGNYSNGYQYDVTNNCTYTCNDPVTYSDTKITASLDEVTLDIPIVVNGIPVQAPSSVIALYHLDNNLKDEVSGNNGTGTYKQMGGKFNYCAKGLGGSGASNYQTLTQITLNQAQLQSGTFTIEFWAKDLSSSYSYPPLIRIGENKGDNLFIKQAITNGIKIYTNWCPSQSQTIIKTGASGWVKDKWRHYAFVLNRGTFSIFVDGELWTTGPTNNAGNYPFTFALNDSATYIDEVMFCNEAKYTTNFEPPHGPYYLMRTVTFDTDGGSTVASQQVPQGGLVTQPADPTKPGNTFGGWYKENTFTTQWNFATDTVTTNTTIYAKWTEILSTVTFTYQNYTGEDINVFFEGIDPDNSVSFSPLSGESFNLVVPYGEGLDNTFSSVFVTNSLGEEMAIEVQEEGSVYPPVPFIDLTMVADEDKGFEIYIG